MKSNISCWALLLSAFGLPIIATGPTLAQFADPPLADIVRDIETGPARLFAAPDGSIQSGGPVPARDEAALTLAIRYTDGGIANPTTGQIDAVRLRSYHGTAVDPAIPYVAPTIGIYPGETVRITLDNQLPAEPDCAPPGQNVNIPHCFNQTNLHSHGLWVSPTGNSDNVLLSINPGIQFQYEYNIPPDHPAGTFWYHPHKHGSTALQVSSGMAGALLIYGTRLPSPDRPGDIDTLLRDAGTGQPFAEKLLVFEQIQYACRDQNGQIKVKKDAAGKVIAWVCDPGDVGTIESYDQFGPQSWNQSGRYTSINGQIMPSFTGLTAGSIERWRFVHAGVRNTIKLQFQRAKTQPAGFGALSVAEQDQYIADNCTGPIIEHWEFANDGLTRAQIVARQQTTFQPGYRTDALVVFPEPGQYCLIDAAAPAAGSVSAQAESRQFLGMAFVEPGQNIAPEAIGGYIKEKLLQANTRFMPANMQATIAADLSNDLHVSVFEPHKTITDDQLTGKQPPLTFNIDTSMSPPLFEVDGRPYDPARIDRKLPLGGVEEWSLHATEIAGHPFHIHVNPFQIVSIKDAAGNEVSDSGEGDDSEYADMKGVWKDTIFIKPGYTITMRTRYQRYIGEFVLHCHILDHEDQGMMENVLVYLPDGQGGVSGAHH